MSKGFREPDFAQIVTDRVTSQTISEILEQDRDQAERALERRARGTAGVCEDCGENIDSERLAVLPDSTRCIRCQAGWEGANLRK